MVKIDKGLGNRKLVAVTFVNFGTHLFDYTSKERMKLRSISMLAAATLILSSATSAQDKKRDPEQIVSSHPRCLTC